MKYRKKLVVVEAFEPVPYEEPVQLKPCPFCGGEARINTTYWSFGSGRQECKCTSSIKCSDCNFSISADTEQEAKELWNRRA